MTGRLTLIAAGLLLALTPACVPGLTGIPATPAAAADRSKIDEQAALTITLAYTAAARAATVAIEAGLVKDRATIARIGALDRQAYAAVQGVERAYRAGNAASFAAALSEARMSINLFLSAAKGDAR